MTDSTYDQPSLEYYGTTGFVPDSDTSIKHAEFEKKRAASVQETILNAIKSTMNHGATCREIEVVTGLAHQTVSACIRNMELDGYEQDVSRGKVVKLRTIRDGGHAYIASEHINAMHESLLMNPTKQRVQYKKRLLEVLDELESVAHYPEPFLQNYIKGLVQGVRTEIQYQ